MFSTKKAIHSRARFLWHLQHESFEFLVEWQVIALNISKSCDKVQSTHLFQINFHLLIFHPTFEVKLKSCHLTGLLLSVLMATIPIYVLLMLVYNNPKTYKTFWIGQLIQYHTTLEHSSNYTRVCMGDHQSSLESLVRTKTFFLLPDRQQKSGNFFSNFEDTSYSFSLSFIFRQTFLFVILCIKNFQTELFVAAYAFPCSLILSFTSLNTPMVRKYLGFGHDLRLYIKEWY